jgi:hypothetical protein
LGLEIFTLRERPDLRPAIFVPPHETDCTAEPEQARVLPKPCPCCAGRMIIIETFARGCQPKHA